MTHRNQALSRASPGETVKATVMHTGDDPREPSSTPGPGRNRECLGWLVIGCGVTCWLVALVLGVVSVVNWFTAVRW
jgi:hypothetical protein